MGLDIERRVLAAADLEVRRTGTATAQLVGFAVRYDSLSEDIMGFREIIAKGAFSGSLRSDPDVKALVEHNPEKIIGRTRANTLSLEEDESGVRVTINPPDTQIGKDVVTSIERGDLSAMSFGFRAINDSWGTVDGEPVRTVNEAELFDVSVVAFPSYPDTSIAVRSLNRWRKTMNTESVSEQVAEQVTDQETRSDETRQPQPEPARPERRTQPMQPESRAQPVSNPEEWRDYKTGREVRVLKPDQKYADVYKSDEPLSLGRVCRAMAIGDWTDAPQEHRALSTVSNPTAGIMVPNPLAATVIDKARAQSRLVQAGAKTIEMTSSTLDIARVATDATVEVKAENAQFSGSDVEFDAVTMTAITLGVLVKMSRELAADAPNAVSEIENAIAEKLAEKIDFYGLQGTGDQQPLGLTNFSDTNTVNVGGSPDYGDILTGIKECKIDNHTPNAYIMSPANEDVLAQLLINSEVNHFAVPPVGVAALNDLSTNNMPDTDMVVGDFSQFLIGLRQGVFIEVSTEAGTAFPAHQVWIKATWRGCFNTAHRDAFCLLQSIS